MCSFIITSIVYEIWLKCTAKCTDICNDVYFIMLINTLQSQLKSSTLNVLYVKTIFNITSLQSAIFESVLKCVLKNIVFKVHFKWPFISLYYLKIQYFKNILFKTEVH